MNTKKAQREALKAEMDKAIQVKQSHYHAWGDMEVIHEKLVAVASSLALANCCESSSSILRIAHDVGELRASFWKTGKDFHEKYTGLKEKYNSLK